MVRRSTLVAGLLLCFGALAAGQPPAGPEVLVRSEHAFASDVARVGVGPGFARWLAPTSVVFTPGPANGRKVYGARPRNAARLTWEPVVAVMSGSGDLGWTTGPWQWRRDSTHVTADATGDFVTLWRRQADGAWLAALDMGASHDPPLGERPAVELRTLAGSPTARAPLAARRSLWKADAAFAAAAASAGVAQAVAACAGERVRLLDEGALPVIGREAARDSAAARHPRARLMSLAQYLSASGDLGYTYGSWLEQGAAGVDSSYYLHIWERGAARTWELALQLVSPLPRHR
jgi:ketosteroid isomerase-like protein